MIDWMKYRWLYLLISGTVILTGLFSLFKWGLQIGIEFKGGTLIEYQLGKNEDQSVFENIVKTNGVQFISVQKTSTGSYILNLGQVDSDQRQKILTSLKTKAGTATELQFETIGPTVGPELVLKTLYGLLIAASGILLWMTV